MAAGHLLLLLLLASMLLVEPQKVGSVAMATITTESPFVEATESAVSWVREHSNYPPDLEVEGKQRRFPNVSIFRILRHGCFDHDVTRFCGNRMTRFSCLYWIDTHAGDKSNSFKGGAKVEENLKKFGIDAEFFENMDISSGFGAIDLPDAVGQNGSKPPPGAVVLAPPLPSPTTAAAATEEDRLPDCSVYRGRDDLPAAWRSLFAAVLPLFLLVGGLGNLVAALVLARMGRQTLPLCFYTSAISGLDCVLIAIGAGDLWLRAAGKVDVTFMLLFACETCCQTYPMLYSCAAHLRQLCLVAAAVDTLALYTKLDVFYPKYGRERIFNCFVLFAALLLSLNCQFLWTYSISRLDNPGEVNRGYHCGFSDKWVEVRYRSVVWPLLDLAVGDFVPVVVSVACCCRLLNLLWRRHCQWLRPECVEKVVFEPADFLQIRRTAFLTVALELPFSLPSTALYFYKFVTSADHMVKEHIFAPQSLRSLLGTQSHASFLDRKNKQDLFFNVDSIGQVLLFAWLSARPLLHFCCQAAFRRCLAEILAKVRRAVVASSSAWRRRRQRGSCRRFDCDKVRRQQIDVAASFGRMELGRTAAARLSGDAAGAPFLVQQV